MIDRRPGFLGFTVGTLLSTACLRLLPGAMESSEDAHVLLAAFLMGLVTMFACHKLVLMLADHARWGVAAADWIRSGAEGALIAAAAQLGLGIALPGAVALLACRLSRDVGGPAYLLRAFAGMSLGYVAIWDALGGRHTAAAYLAMLIGSCFFYVALATAVPRLHLRSGKRETVGQCAWMLCGVLLGVPG